MAFFDDLGSKLSKAGQGTIQKAKDVADVARINAMISDEEKKINQAYYQIGKLYVSLHQTDYEEDFSGLISGIVSSEIKLEEYRQKIKAIKNINICEKCGAEVSSQSAFCSSCGAPMPQSAEKVQVGNMVKCPDCGKMISQDMRFCTGCGRKMEQAEEPKEEIPVNERICPNCGNKSDSDVDFCVECGTKL